ncbi:uncharacterized protein [Tiliqua scincoides]|uniref:uncharacterized protein n=1 Tax=Tiliqua scincoides TaxID=71010 RepID=UPI00346344C4
MSNCCTVRVHGLPTDLPLERVSDKLMIHFLRARNGGGEIVHIEFLPESPGCAMVTFEDATVTQQVLRAEKHILFVNGKEYPLEVTSYAAEVNPNEVIVYVCMKIDYGRFPDGKDILWNLRRQYAGVQFSFNLQAMTCSVKGSFSELQAFSSELLSCLGTKQRGSSTSENRERSANKHAEGEASYQKVLETQEEKDEKKKKKKQKKKNGKDGAGGPSLPGNPIGSREEPLEDFSLVIDSDVHLYMQKFCSKEFSSILHCHQVGVVDVSSDGVTTLYLRAISDEAGDMGTLVSAHLAISQLSQQLELTLRKEKISKRDLGASACQGLPEMLQGLCPLLLCHEDDRHFYLIGNLVEVSQAKQYVQNLIAAREQDQQKPEGSQQLALIQDKSDVLGQIKSLEESVPRKPSSPKFTGKAECKLAAKFGSFPSFPSRNAPLDRQLPRALPQAVDYQISDSQHSLEVVAAANKSETLLKQPVEYGKAPDRMKADPLMPLATGNVPSSDGWANRGLTHSLPSHVPSSTLRSLNLFDTTGAMALEVLEPKPLLRRCSSSLSLKPPNNSESMAEPLPVDRVSVDHSQQKNIHPPLQKEISKEEVAQMEREVRSCMIEERPASPSSLTVPSDSGTQRMEILATHPDYISESYSYSELAMEGPEDEALTDLCNYLKKCCGQVLISKDKYKLDIAYPRDVKLQVLEAFRCFSSQRVAALSKQLLSCDSQQGKIQNEIPIAEIQRSSQWLKASSRASLLENPLSLGSLAREESSSQIQRLLDFNSLQPAIAQNFPNDRKAWQTKGLDRVPDFSKQSCPGKPIVEIKRGLPDKFHFGRDWSKERCGREVEGAPWSLPIMPLSESAPVPAQAVGKRSPPAGEGDTPDVTLRTASPGRESKAGACELCRSAHADTYHTPCGCTLCKACFSTSDVAPSFCRASPAIPGAFAATTISQNLPGYFRDPTLKLTYDIPDGVQQARDPRPGYPYQGGHFEAFLPDNPEGQRLMVLLHKAFERGLTFQIRSSGSEEWVTWGLIPHKTSMEGGKSRNGYPDAQYLRQLSQKLEDLGIK